MKIGLLIWNYWPALQGGSERQARLISHELVRLGLDCKVYTARTNYSLPILENDGEIQVRRLGLLVPVFLAVGCFIASLIKRLQVAKILPEAPVIGRFSFWLAAPWSWLARLDFVSSFVFLCILGRVRCDIMHLHEPSWLGGVAQLASRWIGCEVLCQEATSPAMPVIGYDTPLRWLWARLRLKPYYIGMAEYTVEQLVERGIPRSRIYHLPNGVKVPLVASNGMASLNCICVANFSQGMIWKAFDVLFAAWAMVVKKIPDARLYAVGGGDPSKWRKFVEDKGVADTVIFTGATSDIDSYYKQSAIFFLPSRVEGMSNALLEAQIWGLACVVSDIQGNVAVVRNGVNGLVVPVNDAGKLAGAIVAVLSDVELRGRLGQAARKTAVERFGIGAVSLRLVDIYKDILARRTGS